MYVMHVRVCPSGEFVVGFDVCSICVQTGFIKFLIKNAVGAAIIQMLFFIFSMMPQGGSGGPTCRIV